MRTPRQRAAPTLAEYATPKAVLVIDRHWEQIITWQRQGLVSVKPISKDRATVELTEKGRAAL